MMDTETIEKNEEGKNATQTKIIHGTVMQEVIINVKDMD